MQIRSKLSARSISAVLIQWTLLAASPGLAKTVTFDGQPIGPFTSLTDGGFEVTFGGPFDAEITPGGPACTSECAVGDGLYVLLRFAVGGGLHITRPDGQPFSPRSVALAEFEQGLSVGVIVVGYPSGGGPNVSTSFITDAVHDGTGPDQDFETFSFPPEFVDLERVEMFVIAHVGVSFDSIELSTAA